MMSDIIYGLDLMTIIANTRPAPFGAVAILRVVNAFNTASDMMIASYKAKQTRDALSKLSARQLEDIGLSFDDIAKVSRQNPLTR